MSHENLTDIEKVELAYKILNSVDDIVTRLWRIAWGLGHKNCMSAYEYDKTLMFIEKYGYDIVRIGFQEAASHNAYSLSYVEKVVTNKTTREAAEKEEKEHKKRMAEQKELAKKQLQIEKDNGTWAGFAKKSLDKNI